MNLFKLQYYLYTPLFACRLIIFTLTDQTMALYNTSSSSNSASNHECNANIFVHDVSGKVKLRGARSHFNLVRMCTTQISKSTRVHLPVIKPPDSSHEVS